MVLMPRKTILNTRNNIKGRRGSEIDFPEEAEGVEDNQREQQI